MVEVTIPKVSEETGCPVDHETRSAWLKAQADTSQQSNATCNSAQVDQGLPLAKTLTTSSHGLSTHRETSTIPRTSLTNGNTEMPATSIQTSGNWIYPSEEMFFNAMTRKNWDPKAADMHTIVPIHNAVNERAWVDIKEWEKGRGSEKCGGPKLVSFSGDAKQLTPKARLLVLLGYQAPFDRHDWVVDRCGKKIEYIIDFYSGKRDPKNPSIPSFYLDVRPKLSFEGALMRLNRWIGL